MPHDSGGVKLKVGDVVLLRARVREICPDADVCNATFEIEGEGNGEYKPTLTCNSKCCTKAQ